MSSKRTAAASRILVVDDDPALREMLAEYLGAEGFAVSTLADGAGAPEALLAGDPDLVVLDLMLPGIDGFEILRRLRTRSTVPVIMLTARGDDLNRILGLEIGADDYIPKPFNPRELVARIRAVLRRSESSPHPVAGLDIPQGRLVLSPARLDASVNGASAGLTGSEFRILESLAARAGEVVSREALAGAALGRRPLPYDRALDTHVSNLRRKLGGGGDSPVRSVRGRGYQLVTLDPEP